MKVLDKILGLDKPVDEGRRKAMVEIGGAALGLGAIIATQFGQIQDALAGKSCPENAPAPAKISERELAIAVISARSLVYLGDPYNKGKLTLTKDAKVKFPDGSIMNRREAVDFLRKIQKNIF